MDQPQWEIGLFECGDLRSCVCAYTCSPCALASARSHLDDSAYAFNIVCLPICCITPVRWMIRTAYDIEGDACSDCYKSTFCPCCVLNQLLQTAFVRGNSSVIGGSFHNVKDFSFYFGTCNEECRSCIFANLCCPCAVGSSLNIAMGMPYIFGCCCVTPCAARNIVRYQYRLRGDDLMEEFCGPIAGVVALYGVFLTPLVIFPVISTYSSQCYNEAMYRGKSATPKYLVPMSSNVRPNFMPQMASDMAGGSGAGDGDTGSEVSSIMTSATNQADKHGADADENSPLLSGVKGPGGGLVSIPEGTAIDSISSFAESRQVEPSVGYARAKIASNKDKRKQYVQAEAAMTKS